ncbi:MAG: Lrp/AsnC family transcriptional regulator [Candidatus Bathycorpusculaceae bacterium]
MLLDENDKKIISILQDDGRTSFTDIGKKLGFSHVSVRKRLGKLDNLIKVTAGLNAEKFCFRTAIVNAEVESHKRLLELIERFSKCPRIIFMAKTTGAYNLMTIMCAEDADTLNAIIEVCSVRAEKGIRRSEVVMGEAPIIPKYLPIKIITKKTVEIAPCGINCGTCIRYKEGKCSACPATRYYRGSL